MKFSKIITTFKNGLVSPLIRGRRDIEGIESGAEEFENFRIDSIGASHRRPPTRYAQYIEKSTHVDETQSFIFTLLGADYNFNFNKKYNFNENDAVTGKSNYLTINNLDGARGPFVFGSSTLSPNIPAALINWNVSAIGVFSELDDYLNKNLTILQYTQVSDRTVVFTTNHFSFCVSLVNYELNTALAAGRLSLPHFFVYPFFVNLSSILANQQNVTTTRKCPLYPTNYPFNFPNTDTSKKIYTSEVAGQAGTVTGSGVQSSENNKFVSHVDIPYALHESGAGLNDFEGAFIRVATEDSKEAVFFITQGVSDVSISSILYRRYLAIMCIGGVTSASGTSVFSISTWRDRVGYPKVLTTFKTRLMFANAGRNSLTTVWAAAVNNDSPFDFQGFMEDTLIQDVGASDVSGLKYFNSNNPTKRGFSLAFSDGDGQEIRWMMARNRLHLGTSNGEYQITVAQSFTRDSANQSRIGSIASDFIQPVGGDRKIIYCANEGTELRYISVEDRDYESVDNKFNSVLAGLDVTVKKLQWYEKLRILIILTEEGEVYGMSLDSILQVTGFSLWKFPFQVLDIAASNTQCMFVFNVPIDPDTELTEVKGTAFLDFNLGYNALYSTYNYLDVYYYQEILSLVADYASVAQRAARILGECQVTFYNRNRLFTSPVIDETFNSASPSFSLPTEMVDEFQIGDQLLVGVKYRSRIRTLPLHEGSQYGSALGDIQRIDRATFQMFRSGKFKYGSADTSLYESEGLSSGQVITKDYTYELPQNSDREQFVVIETDETTPLSISGVGLRGLSNPGE